jgi:hypothetical protein
MELNNQGPPPSPLSQQETDALNKHGVFFKKRVLQELRQIREVEVVAEELGVSFGETRVIDIVAAEKHYEPHLLFVFECKRAYAADRKWIFFPDSDWQFRVSRMQTAATELSIDHLGRSFPCAAAHSSELCNTWF